jgi:serine/threonine protein kinase
VSLFRAIAKSFVKNFGNVAASLVGVPVAGSIVFDAWDYWKKDSDDRNRKAELERVARQAVKEALPEALEAIHLESPQLQEAKRQLLADYLCQLPASIRRSLRRPEDRTGTTVPATLTLAKPNDLLPLLPAKLPRFRPGDHPLANSDLELVELLGQGGFGEVWKAKHLDRPKAPPVALKFCLDPSAAQSLRRERDILDQIASSGKYDGIVQLLYTHLRADPPCVEFEYIDGGNLTSMIRAHQRDQGGFDPLSAAGMIKCLAEIVGFAHRLQPAVVHRDLKPANILMQTEAGRQRFKIADFGIGGIVAQLAQAEAHSGAGMASQREVDLALGAFTPLYASPEQMEGHCPDPRDDVHALGMIWYQLQTGNLTATRLPSYWRDELTDAKMPEPLLALLAECIGRLERRPRDGIELASRLRALLGAGETQLQAQRDGPPALALSEPAKSAKVHEVAKKLRKKDHVAAIMAMLKAAANGRDAHYRLGSCDKYFPTEYFHDPQKTLTELKAYIAEAGRDDFDCGICDQSLVPYADKPDPVSKYVAGEWVHGRPTGDCLWFAFTE